MFIISHSFLQIQKLYFDTIGIDRNALYFYVKLISRRVEKLMIHSEAPRSISSIASPGRITAEDSARTRLKVIRLISGGGPTNHRKPHNCGPYGFKQGTVASAADPARLLYIGGRNIPEHPRAEAIMWSGRSAWNGVIHQNARQMRDRGR